MSRGKIVGAIVAVLVCVCAVALYFHLKGLMVRASTVFPEAFGSIDGKRYGTLKPEPISLKWCLRDPNARTLAHFRAALRTGDDTVRKSLYVALFVANGDRASEGVLQLAGEALKEGGDEEGKMMRLAALHWLRSVGVEKADPERSGDEVYCLRLGEQAKELPPRGKAE